MIGIRLYTGPAYVPINGGLRAGGKHRKDKKVMNFPVTCSVINSAIRKLSQVTPIADGRRLYRGLSGMRINDETLKDRDFVEFGFSSATTDRDVALQYATKGKSLSTLFEIEIGKIDNGAALDEYSQCVSPRRFQP